jgi:NAD(P)-dependent dehydrogenase (short-subunit alcohol dehydrogenase family)
MIDFSGQVAIVTGAGRGMGRSIAKLFAERGASVLVNDYGGDEFGNPGTSKEAEAVADEIRAADGKAVANSATVGDGAGADAIVRAALEAFGRIDVLVNNAGGSTIAPIDELTDAALERVMRTNYWGAYMLIRRVWPHMRAQRYGRIINVCSSAVLGIGTIAPYSSAKGAMVGLTHEAAIEGKPHGILVNGTFPAGYSRLVAKSAEDARRWMEKYFQPELVAQAYAYFASRDMQHTGEIYSVGAGRVSRIALFNNDGYFNRELTPELVAANIDRIRDLSDAVHVGSSWEENQRYQRWVPWTGGHGGTFGGEE